MDSIRSKLNKAAMELKIAVFCGVIMGLSIVYKMIDPNLGKIISNLAIATFCMSLIVFVYKFIFGSMGIVVILILLSTYVTSLGVVFQISEVVYGGIVFILLLIALKAFIWIFFKKKSKLEEQLLENESKTDDN